MRPASRGRLLWIPSLLVVLGLGGWWWSAQRKVPEGQSPERSRVQATVHLDTFVLNLADQNQRSYLRVGIDLGLHRELKHGEDPEVARVRDTIVGVLALSRVDDLLTAKGKVQLKQDLLQALRERVPELGVEEVYFTEFLIQR